MSTLSNLSLIQKLIGPQENLDCGHSSRDREGLQLPLLNLHPAVLLPCILLNVITYFSGESLCDSKNRFE